MPAAPLVTMTLHAGRKGRRWRTLCAQVYAEETHCVRCGQPVDQSLPPRTPRSRSVDHIIPLDAGGAPYARENVGLAHYGCNGAHGARHRWSKRQARGVMTIDIDPHSL